MGREMELVTHSKSVEEEEEQWEKVTTVKLGKQKRVKPISTEDKWENVNSEMKKVLERRRRAEDEDDGDEWKKVEVVGEPSGNDEIEWKRVDVGESSFRNAVDFEDEEEWVKLTDIK